MSISDDEVEAALASWFGDDWPRMGELARSGLNNDMRAALRAAAQVRANSEGDAEVMLDLIREEVSKSNSPLGRSDSLAIDRVRSLLGVAPFPTTPGATS